MSCNRKAEVRFTRSGRLPLTMTSAIIYELPKADLAPLLENRPQVAQEFSYVLALRQAAGRTIAAAILSRYRQVGI
jgi:hypothetical protein